MGRKHPCLSLFTLRSNKVVLSCHWFGVVCMYLHMAALSDGYIPFSPTGRLAEPFNTDFIKVSAWNTGGRYAACKFQTYFSPMSKEAECSHVRVSWAPGVYCFAIPYLSNTSPLPKCGPSLDQFYHLVLTQAKVVSGASRFHHRASRFQGSLAWLKFIIPWYWLRLIHVRC